MKNKKKMGLAMSLGIAFGAILGYMVDNVGAWIAIGLALGAGIGSWLERSQNSEE